MSQYLNEIEDDISKQFKRAMFESGIDTDEIPIADGQLHRIKIDGVKNGKTSGGYVLFGDGNPAGCFWSFKLGINETWTLKYIKELSPQERTEFTKRMDKAKKERDKAQAIVHKEARVEAERIWSNDYYTDIRLP
ncbi:MAG TPA: hypothetical protein EYQ42_02640 [Thiotrichaceae bacterium]|jgi:putative DNA primase/helicase|nr:hypothetical protein [Thiotrichaceae bacterium]